MKIGWNGQYIRHCLTCREWLAKASNLLIVFVITVCFIFAFPISTEIVYPDLAPGQLIDQASLIPIPDRVLAATEELLAQHEVERGLRGRVARAIAVSSRKHNVDPRLVTSIMIVESRANPFAISHADAVGIMQVHLGTWGEMADREGVNLFKVEDNVDFGVRILKDYIDRYGLWGGVRRYKGWTDAPGSREDADLYVQKVQRIYDLNMPTS
jgi:hypothetical protein